MAAQGELERKQNGRQVSQKMAARMQSGYWLHRAPVGYRYETLKGHGKLLVPDEPCASIVRDAFEGYASGQFQTQAEVKRFLEQFPDFPRNNQGILTQQRVTDILTHPIYAGYICSERYNVQWLKAQHEALISLETFEKVQARREGIAKAPKRKNIGDSFALRGMVECAGCHVPLRSSYSKGRYKSYAYYLCQTKECDHYGKSIPREKIESEIGDLVKELKPTPGLIKLATAMFRKAWDMRKSQAQEIVVRSKLKLKDIDKQKQALIERLLDASDPAVIDAYESKLSEIERQRAV